MFKKEKINKRIGIDARFYGPIGKGLGRYTQEMVDNILMIDNENEYVVFLRRENFDEFVVDSKNVKKVIAEVRWYSLAEQILMPFYIWREKLDFIHFPHFNVPVLCPTKFIVTIHDLILTKFPTTRATTLGPLLYKIKNLAYKITIWLAVRRAKKIIAVSEFTKNDIVEQFGVGPDKIITIYEGVANLAKGRDSLFAAKLDEKETLSGYHIDNPFLLYVGNAYPHKNLEGLIDIFSDLRRDNKNLNLVLVGREDYFYRKIKQYAASLGLWRGNDIGSPIIFPGYVPDAKLEVLYQKALIYIFPSLYEGFGLPPLEAMARGCPVVSSNKASMPEILGEAAIYFNPENKNEMIDVVRNLVADERLREELIKKGYDQVRKYNWWEAASQTLEVYKNI